MSNIFLSWSGKQSKAVAESFQTLLTQVIQAADPFISSESIGKGRRWDAAIADGLNACKAGVIFVTRNNIKAPWLLFEAGAIAKSVSDAYCCTYLIDLTPGEVDHPLGAFQHTVATEADTLALLKTLNVATAANRGEAAIEKSFEKFWPDFQNALATASVPVTELKTPPLRSEREMLEEILEYARRGVVLTPLITEQNINKVSLDLGTIELQHTTREWLAAGGTSQELYDRLAAISDRRRWSRGTLFHLTSKLLAEVISTISDSQILDRIDKVSEFFATQELAYRESIGLKSTPDTKGKVFFRRA